MFHNTLVRYYMIFAYNSCLNKNSESEPIKGNEYLAITGMGCHLLLFSRGCFRENWPCYNCTTMYNANSPILTSWNGNVFRVAGPLWGEATDGFPSQRPVTRSFDVFFDLRLNKRLSQHSRRLWFETPSRSSWATVSFHILSVSPKALTSSSYFSVAIDNLHPRNTICWNENNNETCLVSWSAPQYRPHMAAVRRGERP